MIHEYKLKFKKSIVKRPTPPCSPIRNVPRVVKTVLPLVLIVYILVVLSWFTAMTRAELLDSRAIGVVSYAFTFVHCNVFITNKQHILLMIDNAAPGKKPTLQNLFFKRTGFD